MVVVTSCNEETMEQGKIKQINLSENKKLWLWADNSVPLITINVS